MVTKIVMTSKEFEEAIKNVPLLDKRIHSDWHWTFNGRFDYYPTKGKWYDRGGIYGSRYNLYELLDILSNGAIRAKPKPPLEYQKTFIKDATEFMKRDFTPPEPAPRPLKQILDDLENLLTELRSHQ